MISLLLGPIDLAAVATDAIEAIVTATKARKIEITFFGSSQAPPLRGDANRWRCAISTLLSEAVTSDDGGRGRSEIQHAGIYRRLCVADGRRAIARLLLAFVLERRQAGVLPTHRGAGSGIRLTLVPHFIEPHFIELHGGAARTARPSLRHGASIGEMLHVASFESATEI